MNNQVKTNFNNKSCTAGYT